jgi:hypothetical protein
MTEALALQHQTLRLYGELQARASSWAGKLILSAGPGCSASGLAAAGSIAGATTLVIDPNTSAVRSTLREGGVDFVVNTLDEAFRVLKNEIRQGRPLGVALTAESAAALAEAHARGLLPDLVVQFGGDSSESLLEALARSPGGWLPLRGETHTPVLNAFLHARGWQAATLPADTPAAVRELDARLLALFSGPDDPRTSWLKNISRYQRSASREGRAIWLSESEGAALGEHAPPLS